MKMKRTIAKWLYKMMGWKVDGEYPYHIPKKILIVAPHTSSMDFYVGILMKIWYNIECKFYAKAELFTGIRGYFLRKLGALPVDRGKNNNLVKQAVKDFLEAHELTILITPEGTRNKVTEFKTGFYHIAHLARVPIIPVQFDFEHKKIRILTPYFTSDNLQEDMRKIMELFRGIKGKYPERSIS